MTCNGTCVRYKSSQKPQEAMGQGGRWCRICSLYLDWEGKHCPCCSYMIRRGPRRLRAKILNGIEVKRI